MIKLVKIEKLRAHEKVSPKRVVEIKNKLKQSNCLKNPVIVDKETLVILDGHHRVEALKQLGCKKVLVMMVDYMSDEVRVSLRCKNLIKNMVIKKANSGSLFGIKTTKHLIKNRIRGVNIGLDVLESIDGKNKTKIKESI